MAISEGMLKHMLAVARKAYKIAKEEGHHETFARRCFMLGYVHDVGFEFCQEDKSHALEGARMLFLLYDNEDNSDTKQSAVRIVREHGCYKANITDEYRILNTADMLTDDEGNDCDIYTKLDFIKNKYGASSEQYYNACDLAYYLGLTDTNIGGEITCFSVSCDNENENKVSTDTFETELKAE